MHLNLSVYARESLTTPLVASLSIQAAQTNLMNLSPTLAHLNPLVGNVVTRRKTRGSVVVGPAASLRWQKQDGKI